MRKREGRRRKSYAAKEARSHNRSGARAERREARAISRSREPRGKRERERCPRPRWWRWCLRRALSLAAGSPKFVQKGLCRRRSRLTRCQPRFHGEGLDGRMDGRTDLAEVIIKPRWEEETRTRRGWTRGAEEEEDDERRPRGCQCGLWKRVSKFNLTECRGVQPPLVPTPLHPAASRCTTWPPTLHRPCRWSYFPQNREFTHRVYTQTFDYFYIWGISS